MPWWRWRLLLLLVIDNDGPRSELSVVAASKILQLTAELPSNACLQAEGNIGGSPGQGIAGVTGSAHAYF
jgi:hypothetical protein